MVRQELGPGKKRSHGRCACLSNLACAKGRPLLQDTNGDSNEAKWTRRKKKRRRTMSQGVALPTSATN